MSDRPQRGDLSAFWDFYGLHYQRMGHAQPLPVATSQLRERLSEATWLPPDKEARILDVGFGWGHLLLSLWATGYKSLSGIEVSQPMYRTAAQYLPAGIQLECGESIAYLDRHPDDFDLITLFDVIEHIPTTQALELLRGCCTALRAGGRVVIRTPNMAHLLAAYIRYSDATHVQGYTEWSLYQLLDAAGFSDHQIAVESTSGLAGWRRRANLRHPLAGLNLERLLSVALHRLLYALHPQVPRPSVWDFNILVVSSRDAK